MKLVWYGMGWKYGNVIENTQGKYFLYCHHWIILSTITFIYKVCYLSGELNWLESKTILGHISRFSLKRCKMSPIQGADECPMSYHRFQFSCSLEFCSWLINRGHWFGKKKLQIILTIGTKCNLSCTQRSFQESPSSPTLPSVFLLPDALTIPREERIKY